MSRKQMCRLYPLYSMWTMNVHSCTNSHVYGAVTGRPGRVIIPRSRTSSIYVGDQVKVAISGYQGAGIVTASQV